MNDAKIGRRMLGLISLIVFCLGVFLTTGAQANWLYLESGVAKDLTAKEVVKVEKHTESNLLLFSGIEIRCAKIEGNDLLLEPGNATTALASGKMAFSECHTFNKGTATPKCDPLNQPIVTGLKIAVIFHEGKNYLLAGGLEGKPFTTLEFDEEFCSLVETSEVAGALVFECGQLNGFGVFVGEDCANHAVSHLVKQAPQALFPGDEVKFGLNKASLDGIVKVEFAGLHQGQSWSGEVGEESKEECGG